MSYIGNVFHIFNVFYMMDPLYSDLQMCFAKFLHYRDQKETKDPLAQLVREDCV